MKKDKEYIIQISIIVIFIIIVLGFIILPFNNSNNDNNINSKQNINNINSEQNINNTNFSKNIGKMAPDFTLEKQDGSKFTLSDYKGKTVILFFNEGSMCYPACWNQIIALGKDKRFNNDTTVTVSIVVDSKSQWDKILSEQKNFNDSTILFDTNKKVSKIYDILDNNSSMHKGILPGHTYIIINPKGKITYTFDDPKMGINNEALFLKIN